MVLRSRILLVVYVWTGLALGTSPAPGASTDPQAEYEALRELSAIRQPPGVERGTDAFFEWVIERARTMRERGLAFFASHPTHPRRWDVLVLLQYSGNLQIIIRADGSKYATAPAAEAALWRQEYLGRLEDLLESKDAGTAARHTALMQLIDYYSTEIRRGTIDNPRRGLVPSLLLWVDELRSLDANSGGLALLYLRVARMLNALDPAVCTRFLDDKAAQHRGSSFTDREVRRQVENFRRLMHNQEQPADELWQHLRRIEPTIDRSQYAGRVVLIAYLAVDWTINTLQLEELYQSHHDAGLDIIHIAYENRGQEVIWDGIRRTTRPAPLVQRDRATMERFVDQKQWPWPVLWDTDSSEKRLPTFWALNTVPAFLIVGRDGRLAREIPGEVKLETRIARELSQPRP